MSNKDSELDSADLRLANPGELRDRLEKVRSGSDKSSEGDSDAIALKKRTIKRPSSGDGSDPAELHIDSSQGAYHPPRATKQSGGEHGDVEASDEYRKISAKEVVEQVIEHPENDDYYEELHKLKKSQIMELLDSPGEDGHSVLHAAAWAANVPVVDFLITNIKDFQDNAWRYIDTYDSRPNNRAQSPLTLIIESWCSESPSQAPEAIAQDEDNVGEDPYRKTFALLLNFSRFKADALCTAIRLYEECDRADKNRIKQCTFVMNQLLGTPMIVGSEDTKGCVNQEGIPEGGRRLLDEQHDQKPGLRPLQLAAFYRDKGLFLALLNFLPPISDNETPEPQRLDSDGNSILQIAVQAAKPNDENDEGFIYHLLTAYTLEGMRKVSNSKQQTALWLVCAQRNATLFKLFTKPVYDLAGIVVPDENVNNFYVGPDGSLLHSAARYGNVDVLELLFSTWPLHCETALSQMKGIAQKTPYQLALESERAALLRTQDPDDDYYKIAQLNWLGVQESLLKTVHRKDKLLLRNFIVDSQFNRAEKAISEVDDEKLQASLTHFLKQLKKDYEFTMVANVDSDHYIQAIAQNREILRLVNELSHLAHEFTPSIYKSNDGRKVALNNFVKLCSGRLDSDLLKAIFVVVVLVATGIVFGAAIGFFITTLATGSTLPFVLLPAVVQWEAIIASLVSAALGGLTGLVVGVKSSKVITMKSDLWAIDRAMHNNISAPRIVPLAQERAESIPYKQLVEEDEGSRQELY